MPAPHETPFTVFYSWQSDLPDCVNLKLIRNALNQAASTMTADDETNLQVIIDEATRWVSGSPSIPDSIFSKIRKADVFVCDLTKVAEVKNEAEELRIYCNPNAAIELGYAVRVLGWERIIIVFNKGYGVVPGDLPFDVDKHRCSTYCCKADLGTDKKPTPACQQKIQNATGHLRNVLIAALKLIATNNPKRPHETESKNLHEIQRERDLDQLQKVFEWIHLGTMDQVINAVAQGHVLYVGEHLMEGLSGLLSSTSFHIFDQDLRSKIIEFIEAWQKSFEYSYAMDAHPNGQYGYFRMPGDYPISAEQGKQFSETCQRARPLREKLDALLDCVREHYLEIDLSQTGKGQIDRYWELEREFRNDLKNNES